MTDTARLGLPYPTDADPADVPTWMRNLALDLDTLVPSDAQGAIGSRPVAGVAGRYYTSTNEGLLPITYRDDGTAWRKIGGVPRVTTIPASPADGDLVLWQPPQGAALQITTWLMRWNAATSRWEYLGGAPLLLRSDASVASSTVLPLMTSSGPSYTNTKTGTYDVRFGGWMAVQGAANPGYGQLAVLVGGAVFGQQCQAQLTPNNAVESSQAYQGTIAKNAVITMAAGHLAGSGLSTTTRWMEIHPIAIQND